MKMKTKRIACMADFLTDEQIASVNMHADSDLQRMTAAVNALKALTKTQIKAVLGGQDEVNRFIANYRNDMHLGWAKFNAHRRDAIAESEVR